MFVVKFKMEKKDVNKAYQNLMEQISILDKEISEKIEQERKR